jgi:hypothetical protein
MAGFGVQVANGQLCYGMGEKERHWRASGVLTLLSITAYNLPLVVIATSSYLILSALEGTKTRNTDDGIR